MSTVTPHNIFPRKRLGRTFVVAISLLGVFALYQLLALFGHFIPSLRQQLSARALESQRASNLAADQQARPAAPTPAPLANDQAPSNNLSATDRQAVVRLMTEANRMIRIEGDYEGALKLLDQAETIVPGDPKVLRSKAFAYEKLDQLEDAASALDEALRFPALPANERAEMEKKLDQLSVALGSAVEKGTSKSLPADNSAPMEENGVPVGSSLGIVDIRLSDPSPTMKNMQVALKARESAALNVKDVKILVYFYEENPPDGDVQMTESKPAWQWLSLPIDWAANEPELLKIQYATPTKDTGKKYHGYVVGIYYKNELQDFRSEPSKLARDFPLPLSIKPDPNENPDR